MVQVIEHGQAVYDKHAPLLLSDVVFGRVGGAVIYQSDVCLEVNSVSFCYTLSPNDTKPLVTKRDHFTYEKLQRVVAQYVVYCNAQHD